MTRLSDRVCGPAMTIHKMLSENDRQPGETFLTRPISDQYTLLRATVTKVPGVLVWLVSQRGDRLTHPLPRRGTHVRFVVDDARHGLYRHAGKVGDIDNGWAGFC